MGNGTKDLTVGKPIKLVLTFAIPVLFGYLFQQCYNIVDTIIVGQFLGTDALAAVGATGSINFLILGFCNGLCAGCAIPLAQKFGAKDYSGLRKYIGNCLWVMCFFGIVITFFTVVYCRQILVAMKTPGNILDGAYAYIVIIFAGIPVTLLYNMVSGIIRSVGDSKTPVYFLMLASGVNIGLDLLFIGVFHTGVYGAAVATVISQGVSGVSCLLYMIKRYDILRISRADMKFEWHLIMGLCNMGIPMGLQYSITAIGSVILQTAVNTLGSTAVAAMTAGGRIGGFFCCVFDALGTTMATYAGQNVGAGKLERLYPGVRDSSLLAFAYSILIFGLMLLFGDKMALLFIDKKEENLAEILHMCSQLLIVNSSSYILLSLVNIVRFAIQGMGFGRFAMLAGVMEMVARTLVAIILVPVMGFLGACLANPLAWLFADLFLIPAFFWCRKNLAGKLVEA